MIPNHVGSISETAVTLDLLGRGYNVLLPTVVCRYDLLVEVPDRFVRVQVKTARTNRNGNLRVSWDQPYTKDEVDLIAVYDPRQKRIYYIPIDDIPEGSRSLTIRVKRVRGNTSSFKAEKYARFPVERMIPCS